MNMEMHLHLNSKFASNEFRTEFPLNLDLQSREQATVSKKHATMSVGGHALPQHPLILKWLMPPPPTSHPPPVFQSSRVRALFAGMV